MSLDSPANDRHRSGAYQVPDAGYVAYHDRGWYCQLEKEGGRDIQRR